MDVYRRGCFTDRVRRKWIGVWLLVATAVSYGQAVPAAEPASRSRRAVANCGARAALRRQQHRCRQPAGGGRPAGGAKPVLVGVQPLVVRE